MFMLSYRNRTTLFVQVPPEIIHQPRTTYRKTANKEAPAMPSAGTLFNRVLLICFLILSLTVSTAFAAGEDVPLGDFAGVIAYSNTSNSGGNSEVGGVYMGFKWECVEYVRRFYYMNYGIDLASKHTGNAETFFAHASDMGLVAYGNGDGTPPEVGDIVCSNYTVGDAVGHVAIVKSVDANGIHVIEQNFNNDARDVDHFILFNGNNYTLEGFSGSYSIIGWLRPRINTLWTRQIKMSGSWMDTRVAGVATDASGNVYTAGLTWGRLDDGYVNAGRSDCFVVKYGPDGVKQWTRQFGTSTDDWASGVAVDGSGDVYVSGFTWGGLHDQTSAGWCDLFVIKYNSAGVRQWTRQRGTSTSEAAMCVSVDASGNVYVAGHTYGSLDGKANAGGADIFIVMYDTFGVYKGTSQLGTANNDYAYGVSADTTGNVYVAGFTDGNLYGTNAGGTDLFVAMYDSEGGLQWKKQLGTSANDEAYGVAVDNSGYVYAAGATFGVLDENYTPEGGGGDLPLSDAYVVKYNNGGEWQWTRQLGTASPDSAYGVSVDGSGNVYVMGNTDGGLDENTSAGVEDIFVVKYNASGVKQWTHQMGSSGSEDARGVSVDGSGNVYVAGRTSGMLDGNISSGYWDPFVMKLGPAPDPYSSISAPAPGTTLTGTQCTVSGTSVASNGVSFVQVSTDAGTTWQTASGTNPWSFLWSMPTNTTCNLKSRVTDMLGHMETPSAGVTVLVNKALTIDCVTATPASPQVAGSPVTWTTAASGGSGSYKYCYYRKGPDTGYLYVKERDWHVSNSWVWTPTATQVGTNYIKVKVNNSSGGLPVESYTSFKVTPGPLAIQSFGPSPASPKPNGTLITWTATATGGTGSYLYKYWRKGPDTGGLYVVARDWNSSGAWDWTPGVGQVGYNYIKVQVKNSAGGIALYTSQSFKVQ
ncbi:MAG: SBBP repeat-containing protein [Nitrospirae bacterium]|nr:SBBP repeat-containing protein [Nitrospirota bacterium]